MKLISLCRKRIAHFAEEAGGKSHLLYLAFATVLDTSILIRITTGGCLVFCLIVEVLKDRRAA